jgi:hypothetical protein
LCGSSLKAARRSRFPKEQEKPELARATAGLGTL